MSHAWALFIFQDGDILYGEYNGCPDVMLPRMFKTKEECWSHWREPWPGTSCTCQGDPCIAQNEYGDGTFWPGRACREHMVFVGPYSWDDDRLNNYNENGKWIVQEEMNDFIEVPDRYIQLGALKLAYQVGGKMKDPEVKQPEVKVFIQNIIHKAGIVEDDTDTDVAQITRESQEESS